MVSSDSVFSCNVMQGMADYNWFKGGRNLIMDGLYCYTIYRVSAVCLYI